MEFLAPALLVGLAAVAIPIIVHLIQRERKRVVEFPSLMFLRKIPYQSVRRRAIRHWPLLLMRVLAFALLALAFARPFLARAPLPVQAAGGREVVILLDRSASMRFGNHWDRARDEARRVVRALGAEDRASLVLFATDTEIAARSSSERGALLAAIDHSGPGWGATRYGPALRAAAGLLDSSRLPRREVVLVTDFQQTAWDRAQDQHLPPGVLLTPISVADETANLAIAGVTLERTASGDRERITVSAQVVNRGTSAAADREITLESDGHRLDRRRVTVGPRATSVVTFAPFPSGSELARLTVRVAPDRLAVDDVFHAVLTPGLRLPILILESPNAAPDASVYLARALSVGNAPAFEARVAQVDRVSAAEIEAAAVVIANDTRPPAGAAARALDKNVRRGAGLLVVLGGQGAWPTDGPDLLPGRLGGITDRSGTRGGTLGFVDYSHPVFEVFRQPHSGDLTAARMFRYRQLAPSGTVVARFDDGAAALVERRVGGGVVLAWTSTLDSYWNDLALKPVFVPFLHQAMKHLARYIAPRPWFTVGEPLDLGIVPARRVSAGAPAAGLVAVTPSGQREALVTGGQPRPVLLAEQGFYAIRTPERGADDVAVLAVNLEASESDLLPLDIDELVRAVTTGTTSSPSGSTQEVLDEERERRQALWWYLLVGGLLLLAVEAIVANRLPRVA